MDTVTTTSSGEGAVARPSTSETGRAEGAAGPNSRAIRSALQYSSAVIPPNVVDGVGSVREVERAVECGGDTVPEVE